MTTPTAPAPVVPLDLSFTLNGSAQSPLAAQYPVPPSAGNYPTTGFGTAGSNPNRTWLMFQAPKTEPITYSFTNASPNDPAGTVATGCFILAAGVVSPNWGGVVPKGPLYINGGAGGSGILMTLVEC